MPRSSRYRPCGKRHGGPWYGDSRRKVLFERGVWQHFPHARRDYVRSGRHKGLRYRLRADVPAYDPRNIALVFPRDNTDPRVYADGPTNSPHRYHDQDGRLCMWHPAADRTHRWRISDGLLHLVGMAVRHLFCEAYWRETAEWPAPEAPHDADAVEQRPDEESDGAC